MLSPKAKRNLLRVLPFSIIWMVSGWIFLIVEMAATGSLRNVPSTAIQMDYKIFIFASLTMAGVGLVIGLLELVFLENLFAKKSFAKKIFYKLILYAFILSFIILITFPIAASMELGTGVFDQRVWDKYFQYLSSITHFSTLVQMLVALGLSFFYAEISDNIGHGVLINFFTGKYHAPIEEERIFMFLDMKASTTIAEELGHIEYFKLLKEYYADLSDAVIQFGGEIYQYVGDEIIVSWKHRDGHYTDDCIRCFFAMREDLEKRKSWYKKQFGLLPTFKAGIHLGEVTTGEIGVIKKDIFFTGDVLNAAARIQGLCNTYQVDLLVSSKLIEAIKLGSEFTARSMGETELRGKKEKMKLFTIVKK